jgi:hypothetical protein
MNHSNNQFLLEIAPAGKKLLIQYNGIASDPIQMSQDGKYLLLGHGSLIDGFSFRVPKNINFITLTKVGENCVFNFKFDKEIMDFYKRGFTIFDNNDLSIKLTYDGELLLAKLKEKDPRIEFKNHLGSTIANEMLLDFNTSGTRGIGIVDLQNKTNKIRNIINLSNNKKIKFKQILLSTLLSMYDDHTTNKRKNKTFIVCACRSFLGNNPNNRHFARTISGYPNNKTPRSVSNNPGSDNFQ